MERHEMKFNKLYNAMMSTSGNAEILTELLLLEHETYYKIPNSKNSYRVDSGDTNTLTSKHVHVYAKKDGKGSSLYSVNIDGSGHDGCSGIKIPTGHAEFFRNKGYRINQNNILEAINIDEIRIGNKDYTLLIFFE